MSRMNESENDDSIYEQYDGIYEEYQSVNEENGPKEGKKFTETQDQVSARRPLPRLGPRPKKQKFPSPTVLYSVVKNQIKFVVLERPRPPSRPMLCPVLEDDRGRGQSFSGTSHPAEPCSARK